MGLFGFGKNRSRLAGKSSNSDVPKFSELEAAWGIVYISTNMAGKFGSAEQEAMDAIAKWPYFKAATNINFRDLFDKIDDAIAAHTTLGIVAKLISFLPTSRHQIMYAAVYEMAVSNRYIDEDETEFLNTIGDLMQLEPDEIGAIEYAANVRYDKS